MLMLAEEDLPDSDVFDVGAKKKKKQITKLCTAVGANDSH